MRMMAKNKVIDSETGILYDLGMIISGFIERKETMMPDNSGKDRCPECGADVTGRDQCPQCGWGS